MKHLFRTCRRAVLPALLLAAGAARAQVSPAGPLAADPGRAQYAPPAAALAAARLRGATALALPFFDDFTSPLEGAPKALYWVPGGGALVNNRFAIQPLTRGTATLDGLRANGQSYSGQLFAPYGPIDSLTSQPINLAGLGPNAQVALSFAWQAGSIVGAPHRSTGPAVVNLELLVRTDVGAWESVWTYTTAAARVTGFRQQVVLLNQPRYLHGNFQFRFVARGNTSDNSDTWGVDYVLLDRGRAAGLADTTFTDYATSAGLRGRNPSGGLRSPLRRFAAMPAWQFRNSELNPELGVNVVNLFGGLLPTLIGVRGTVRDLTNGTALGTWQQRTRPVSPRPRLDSVRGDATRQSVPVGATPRVLRYTLALNTQENNATRNTLANDTITRDVELGTYYAYDDGTAENITQLPAFPTGPAVAFAYRFDLNQPDFVRGLRLYPIFTASDRAARSVTVAVWDDAAGQPAATPRASKTFTIPSPPVAGWVYYEVSFDQPVPVSGSFYVGFSQPSQGRELHYGLDLNSTFPARHLWYRNNAGAWDTTNFRPSGLQQRGALMMRPVMTNNVATATAAAREAAAFALYPNPARGLVTVAGPAFARAAVLDALGRLVWAQPAAEAGCPALRLPALPPGVYTVRLTLPDGATIGRRLLLE